MPDALIEQPEILTIYASGGRSMAKIHPDGSIEFGEGFEPNEAARIFWDAVIANMPPRFICNHTQGE